MGTIKRRTFDIWFHFHRSPFPDNPLSIRRSAYETKAGTVDFFFTRKHALRVPAEFMREISPVALRDNSPNHPSHSKVAKQQRLNWGFFYLAFFSEWRCNVAFIRGTGFLESSGASSFKGVARLWLVEYGSSRTYSLLGQSCVSNLLMVWKDEPQ